MDLENEVIRLKNQVAMLKRTQIQDHQAYNVLLEEKNELAARLRDSQSTRLPSSQEMGETLEPHNEGPYQYIHRSNQELFKLEKMYSGNYPTKTNGTEKVSPSSMEYVIVMPNPDFTNESIRFITERQAEKIFRKAFLPEYTRHQHIVRNNERLEITAFQKSFEKLTSFGEGKKYKEGGRISRSSFGAFIDHGGTAKDFVSLIRNILLFKLNCNIGFQTRQVLSSNGRYIYILISASETEIEAEAERIGYDMQLEIGMTDLSSLEPCDDSLRPLRVLECYDPDVNKMLDELHEYHQEMFEGLKFLGGQTTKYKPNGLKPDHWHAYRLFLAQIKNGLKLIEGMVLPENFRMFFYHKLIRNSMKNANRSVSEKYPLQNLWQKLKLNKAQGAYTDFVKKVDPSTGEDSFKKLWKTHRVNEKGKRSAFRNTDRLKLVLSMLYRNVALHELQSRGLVFCHFPLHNHWELYGKPRFPVDEETNTEVTNLLEALDQVSEDKHYKGLINEWCNTFVDTNLPLNRIRNYFGEKIAMYFAFVSFMANFIMVPAIIGVGLFVVQLVFDSEKPLVKFLNAGFCLMMAVWGTCYLEFWRRKERCLAIKWGQTDFKEEEINRPQFKGEKRRSPVTDDLDEIHFPNNVRRKFFLIGFMVSMVLICFVISIVSLLYFLKWQLTDKMTLWGVDWAGPTVSLINAIQIQIFNFIYEKIAVKLNNLENHKTQSEYEDSLIIKTYLFQFVNSFNSLFYIAFLKTNVEGCIVWAGSEKEQKVGASCMDELFVQLVTLFLVTFFKNIVELGIPFAKYKFNRKEFQVKKADRKKLLSLVSNSNFDALKEDIDTLIQLPPYVTREVDGTLDDYLELAVLFGYITLFAVAFPLSCLLSYFALLLEIQVDKFKLLNLVRRPQPMGAKDIGTWWTIFNFNCIVAVFTNVALLVFTAETFEDWEVSSENKYVTFIFFSFILLGFRGWLRSGIPEIPFKYQIVLKRHQAIVEKYLRAGDTIGTGYKGDLEIQLNPKIHCTLSPSEVEPPTANAGNSLDLI